MLSKQSFWVTSDFPDAFRAQRFTIASLKADHGIE
jgi:hypothetical protein